MNRAYLLTGSNQGERANLLAEAATRIGKECGSVAARSPLYETEAWGLRNQAPFLNQALLLQTALPATELLPQLLRIEESMGRRRLERYGPRRIDIDILFFNDAVIREPGLSVPHPEIQNRRFALQCLNDLDPQLVHPVFFKTVAQLLAECTDPLAVHKFS